MLRIGGGNLKAPLFTFAVTALVLVEATVNPVWGAAPDGQEDICTSSAVIFCDNFEARAVGFNDLTRATYKSGWEMSSFSNQMSVIDAGSTPGGIYNGSRALQFMYPASTSAEGIGYMGRTAWSETDLYFRWYQKVSSNFVFSDIATKGVETLINHSPGQSMYFWWNNWGDGELSHYAQNVNVEYAANVNGGPFFPQMNRWYCLEVRFKYNSGASNGALEGWIDDVQRWNYQNVALDSPGTVMTGFILSGYFNRPSSGYPTMYRWFDNVVISRQRVGCLGTPTGSPPASPSALRVR